jgi:hypothetical protein
MVVKSTSWLLVVALEAVAVITVVVGLAVAQVLVA